MTSSKLIAAIFAVVVAAPMAVLAGLGSAVPYGNARFMSLPDVGTLLGRADVRKSYALDLIKRSPLTRAAIGGVNAFNYDVIGYIDSGDVFSGRDGWLFHQNSFKNEACRTDAYYRRVFERIDLFTDVAAGAGIEFMLAIPPAKASVYPEMLHPRSRAYWRCYEANGVRWREARAAEAPEVVDHTSALLEEKPRAPVSLFLAGDTHWSPVGFGFALRQLLAAILHEPLANLPEPGVLPRPLFVGTDLRGMSLLPVVREETRGIDTARMRAYFAERAKGWAFTKVIHDSYLVISGRLMRQAFPHAEYFSMNRVPVSQIAIVPGDRILYSTVESALWDRSGEFAWEGHFGASVLRENLAAARACPGNGPEVAAVAVEAGFTERGSGAGPMVVVPIPSDVAGRICLSLVVTATSSDTATLFFQSRSNAGRPGRLTGNRAIPFVLKPGENRIAIVLPPRLAGQMVGISTTGEETPQALSRIVIAPFPVGSD